MVDWRSTAASRSADDRPFVALAYAKKMEAKTIKPWPNASKRMLFLPTSLSSKATRIPVRRTH